MEAFLFERMAAACRNALQTQRARLTQRRADRILVREAIPWPNKAGPSTRLLVSGWRR
jgi:hypothetical protein